METGHALSLQPFLQPFLRPFYDHFTTMFIHCTPPLEGIGEVKSAIRNQNPLLFFSILKIKKKIKKRNPKPEFRYI